MSGTTEQRGAPGWPPSARRFAHVCLLAEATVLRDRRFGNLAPAATQHPSSRSPNRPGAPPPIAAR